MEKSKIPVILPGKNVQIAYYENWQTHIIQRTERCREAQNYMEKPVFELLST
jgi:hypothetical protein